MPWEKAILNPKFDAVSIRYRGEMRPGADGDLFADDTLIDFKTSTSLSYDWKNMAQILCYAAFIFDQGIKFKRKLIKRVKSVAFYYPRYDQHILLKLDHPGLPRDYIAKYLDALKVIAQKGSTLQ